MRAILQKIFLSLCLTFSPGHDFAFSQEMGPVEDFGPDGRAYGKDRFLLSRQAYGSEDSVGYEGQIRIVKRYDGGGYELETFDYIARCRAVDSNSMLMTFRAGNRDAPLGSVPVDIQKRPAPGLVNAFNLFWAACYGQFGKFK